MKITICCVGKVKEKFYVQAIEEYSKRLSRYCKLEIIEVQDEKTPDNASEAEKIAIMAKEAERILAKISEREYVMALAIEGQQFPSETFSQTLANATLSGYSTLTFIIGGSLGLAPEVKKRAHQLVSFGKLTLPHQLMRLVLIEQIYRAFMIQQGSPYHK